MKLVVAYNGTQFRGLAPNPGVRTVVGELQRVFEPLIGFVPNFVMSGRTDAGVHAAHQVLSLEVGEADLDLGRIQKSVNSRLGPEIVLVSVEETSAEFNARFSATGRSYEYRILNAPVPDPFLAATTWWIADNLDIAKMNACCPHLVGIHDFSSFCKRPKADYAVSLVREVRSATWFKQGQLLKFAISGSAFCHQMVRSIVGFSVAVGVGKRSHGELPEVLAAKDRALTPGPAPPQGLTLVDVSYPDFDEGV